MAQARAIAIIGPAHWNQLRASKWFFVLSGKPPFVLSRLLSFLSISRTGCASDWCAQQEAVYKCIYAMQYEGNNVYVWLW